MKPESWKSKNKLLFSLLAVIALALLVSATSRGFMWDEAHHANPSLFLHNFMKEMPQDPISYAVDYHTHYKFFAVFASYPPLNMMVESGVYSLMGPSILASRIFVIVEAIFMLFFVFKLAELYSRGNKFFPFICVIFTALHPVIFLFSASNMLDVGLTLFIMASSYFFIRFLREEKRRDLFFLAITIALGVMTKVPMILFLIPLLLVMIFERKLYLFRKHGKSFIKAFVIFLVFISPFLLQLGALYSQGMLELFVGHWDRPSGTSIIESVMITEPKLVENSLGVIFNQWFLAPFFLVGLFLLLKKRRDIDKLFFITMAFFFWFYTSNIIFNIADPRFIMPIVPFVVITACYSLVSLSEWIGTKNLKMFIATILVLLAASQSYMYYSVSAFYDVPNLDRAASFIINDADEPTTVLTTWGQPQMFEFARLDTSREIYTMYMPFNEENIERAINGDFSYYQSIEWWELLGIEHPSPDYIILHEKPMMLKTTFNYNLTYFEDNPDFDLLEVIGGKQPHERIFIYRINH